MLARGDAQLVLVLARQHRHEKFILGEPDAKLMRAEYERHIKNTLGRLLPHYREALELKYMDGFSVVEIASKLGMSFKACESLLTRARRAFAVEYEQAR